MHDSITMNAYGSECVFCFRRAAVSLVARSGWWVRSVRHPDRKGYPAYLT